MSYRGIIPDCAIEDTSLLALVKTITVKRSISHEGSPCYLRLVTIRDKDFEQVALLISNVMRPGYYIHFYDSSYLYVIFRDKIFRFSLTDKRSWRQAILYGQQVGISASAMDFWPHESTQEQSWLTYQEGGLYV